jgi:high-affinity Fe2+/Pb2+ permease
MNRTRGLPASILTGAVVGAVGGVGVWLVVRLILGLGVGRGVYIVSLAIFLAIGGGVVGGLWHSTREDGAEERAIRRRFGGRRGNASRESVDPSAERQLADEP